MARPTKFTSQTVKDLLDAIQLGASYESACRYAGITYETFNEWRKGNFPRGADKTLKAEFSDGLTRAIGKADLADLATIRTAAKAGDWRAAAWGLERRHPKEYGKRTLEISGPDGNPIEIRTLAERIAATDGLDVDEILAESTSILTETSGS